MTTMSHTTRATYGFGTLLTGATMTEAIERTTAALKDEGFGVLTTIDVQKTLKEKIDEDFEPYVILGACNPRLAHRALLSEHDLGLLLPCNVIVHAAEGGVHVSVVDPQMMLGVAPDNPALAEVAGEATIRLRRVVEALEQSQTN
jgi:uncharacterized protein (DUF302 family)